jgi:hypothetical protein
MCTSPVYLKGRDVRLEARRIRFGASRNRHRDMVWLDFTAPHTHMVVDVTVTRARTNSNLPAVGAPLPLHGSFVLGVQQAKRDADIRTPSYLGTPSIQTVHDYHPFALEDGGQLAPMAT